MPQPPPPTAGPGARVDRDPAGRDPAGRDPAGRDPADRDLLVRRYGPRRADELLALVDGRPAARQRVRPVAVLALVTLAVLATWVVWAWRSANTGAVTADLLRFADPTSDTSLVVTWSVSRDPGTTVECQVTATDRTSATVGVRSVTVAPRGDRTTQVVTDVRTTSRAANASVGGCRTVPAAGAASPPTPG